MFDLLIQNANVHNVGQGMDIAIQDGLIAAIDRSIPETQAREVLNAEGHLVSSGFVDSHMHLDKVLSLGSTESKTLDAAIQNFTRYLQSVPAGSLSDDIKKRARQIIRMAVASGTTTLRTNANVEAATGLQGIEALNELKEAVRDIVDLRITCLPNFYDGPQAQEQRLQLIDRACADGLIDYVGGANHHHDNCAELTERLFAIAVKHDLPVDFHVDESDEPNIAEFEQVAQLTMQHGYEGRVSCGHVTALNAVDDDTAVRAIENARKADLSIVTLPSCNLYLMGRTDRQPIRRGVTRIREFVDAGVNIAYASDNIRDPFRPLGNADMLEEGLLTAQVAQMVTTSELNTVFTMGTVNAARAMGLTDYGLAAGKRADLVVFDAATAADALLNQATRTHVIKNGRIVARNSRKTDLAF